MFSVYHRLSESSSSSSSSPAPAPAPALVVSESSSPRSASSICSVPPFDTIPLSQHARNIPLPRVSMEPHTSPTSAPAPAAAPAYTMSASESPSPSPSPSTAISPLARWASSISPFPARATETGAICTLLVGAVLYVVYLILAARGWPEGLVSINIVAVVGLCGVVTWRYTAHHDGEPFQPQDDDPVAVNQVSSWYAQITGFGTGCLVGIPLLGVLVSVILLLFWVGTISIEHDNSFIAIAIVMGYLVLGVAHGLVIQRQATRARAQQLQAHQDLYTPTRVGSRSTLMNVVCASMGITSITLVTFFTALGYYIKPSSDRLFHVSLVTLIGAITLFPLDTVCAHVMALRVALRPNLVANKWDQLSVILPHALLRGTGVGVAWIVVLVYLSSQAAAPLWLFVASVWVVLVAVCWYARSLHREWLSRHCSSSEPPVHSQFSRMMVGI